ncbi:MAG: GGDEF domain-containing protein [Clostridiaceae bacterium]|nr:GGDEF domain-containing protein [Clostridiaceae bacterium]
MKKFEDISIALLLNDFHNEYSMAIYRGARFAAEERGISLATFGVGAFESPVQHMEMRTRLFSLVNPDDFDGIFYVSSSLSNYIGLERFVDFATSFSDLPSAHVGIRHDSLLTFGIDNYSGMYDAVNHLIKEHGRNKIAYISGTRGVYEAEERHKAYKQALIDNNITYDERYVYHGSFLREDGVSAVNAFLDERKIDIDGLVGANDHMALYAMKALQRRGISVPKQVSVAGFDDLSSARSCTPAMTTVHQSAFGLGSFAMRRLAEGIRDDKIEMRHEQLPAPLAVRQSCGCRSDAVTDDVVGSEASPDTMSENEQNEREELSSVVNLMTRDMIGNFEIDEIISVLNGHLNFLGIRDFSLSQYVGQGQAEILFDQTGHRREKFPEKQLISGGLARLPRPYYCHILPLFYREENIGFFVSDVASRDVPVLEIIRDHLSSALKGAHLLEAAKRHADYLRIEVEQRTKELADRTIELEKALDVVQETSEKLERLSVMDELTGLYNRRGFLTLAKQQIALKARNNKDLLLVFFDIDGMKKINDTLGHSVGDYALVSFANLLKKAFRSTDVIARIGGDEFVVLAIECSIREYKKVKSRLDYSIKEFNASNHQEFQLSVSAGAAPSDPDTTFTIEQLMEEADAELYKEKKRKKLSQ